MIERFPYCGFSLSAPTAETFTAAIADAVASGRTLTVSYAHMHTVNVISGDPAALAAFRTIDVVAPDGIAVLTSTRWQGHRLTRDNIIVMECSMAVVGPAAVAHGWRLFLFGGAEGIPERAAARLVSLYPGLTIAGTQHGQIRSDAEMDAVIARIRDARPTLLLVGLGQPRQEQWINLHKAILGVPAIVGVGGYLEKMARRDSVYPAWVNRTHLYWLYRIFTEPGRVWTRYSLGALQFAWHQFWCWRAGGAKKD